MMSGNEALDTLEATSRRVVADLQAPRPSIYWADLATSAAIGWGAAGIAVATAQPATRLLAIIAAGLALYRGLCFIHEITHLRRRSMPAFETAWNALFGVPLLLPSFTYQGVHQDHHNLSTYGTSQDPEYLPFARSRRMIVTFAIQSAFILPAVLLLRFLVIAPVGLLSPRFHRWLEVHASSFSMNPEYRRTVPASMAATMRLWELVVLAVWWPFLLSTAVGLVPYRVLGVWYAVHVVANVVNTLRVLGAHDYETDGQPRSRLGQLLDSIDTPGGPWTELWAPVGLRYHALHHYFPGIPYHNLGTAYRRLVESLANDSVYHEATSPALRESLSVLYRKAGEQAQADAARAFAHDALRDR